MKKILDPAGTAIVRKAQIFFAVAGAVATAGGATFLELFCTHCNYVIVLDGWGLLLVFEGLICNFFDLSCSVTELKDGPPLLQVGVAVLANAFLLGLVGTILGLALALLKRKKLQR